MMINQFSNNEKEIIGTSQELFDSFNQFIFSSDTKVFGKLAARNKLFNDVINIPGDIVECGVFKGSGIFTWLKLKQIFAPNSFKKIIGFDYFDTQSLVNQLSGIDKERMAALFESRNFSHDDGYQRILNSMIESAGFPSGDYELVQGDVSVTSYEFVKRRPGAKISLLYLDMDLEVPTYEALKAFWPIISKGGMVVFDEYGYHQWSESIGADRFASEHNLTITPLNYMAPTACIIKG